MSRLSLVQLHGPEYYDFVHGDVMETCIQIDVVDIKNAGHVQAVKTLVQEYFEWGNAITVTKYGYDFDICGMFDDFMKELSKYSSPHGRLYLVKHDDGYIGVGGFKPIDENACELKRMYVRSEFRGKGIGKTLLQRIVSDAKEFGYHEIKLESARFMTNAAALYHSFGFREIKIYEKVESPEQFQSIIYCMKRGL